MTQTTSKAQKYDRQLRLWAASGQAALEDARVCVINATATATEILKNLVLPGIGSFTLVDKKIVDAADTGNNFFLDDCIGTSRAKRATELLLELNEDVEGTYVDEDAAEILETRPNFFRQFHIIITSGLSVHSVLQLGEICWEANIPLIVVRTIGFTGYFRTVVPEHCIVETHPENTLDLRLDKPFPQLRDLVEKYGDFEAMDDHMHGHIPYVVILSRYLERWRSEHGGSLPSTYAEKSELRRLVQSGSRSPDEENFAEAVAAVFRICKDTKVPKEVEDIFNDPKCAHIDSKSTNFWVLARAIRDFVAHEGNGMLPLSGAVPDMKADTQRYIRLQTAYREKSRADIAAVRARATSLLGSVGRSPESITSEEIESACKHAGVMKVVRYRSLSEEYSEIDGVHKGKEIARLLENHDSNAAQYVMIRASDMFYKNHLRYPGVHDEEMESDIGLLKKCVVSILTKWGIAPSVVLDEDIHETCRAGNSELHNIAALMGGLVSQEVIKILTRQYVPMNNICIFNGIKSTSSVFTV